MSIVTKAILNDIHIPYQTRDLEIVFAILRDIPSLDGIYLNGDIGEFSTISRWAKKPEGYRVLKQEVREINMWLDNLQRHFPRAYIEFIEGNHCHRLSRYIIDNAPAFYGLDPLTIHQLLHLKERRIHFVPYTPRQLTKCGESNLYLRHEPLGGGQLHAKNTAIQSAVDIAYGHTHVYQQYTTKKMGPGGALDHTVTATSLGFLGDIDASIFSYRGSRDMWVNGFGLVQVDVETGKYRLDFIRLDDGLAIVNGKVYRR